MTSKQWLQLGLLAAVGYYLAKRMPLRSQAVLPDYTSLVPGQTPFNKDLIDAARASGAPPAFVDPPSTVLPSYELPTSRDPSLLWETESPGGSPTFDEGGFTG